MNTPLSAACRVALLCLVAWVYGSPLSAQNIIRDDSYTDPNFVAFKVDLLKAIIHKDTTELFALVADDVTISDEVCDRLPSECFKDIFRELPPNINPAWDDLYRAVSYGFVSTKIKQSIPGYARKGEMVFQAPSYSPLIPEDDGRLLVLGSNVNVREQPGSDGKVLTRVSYQKLAYNDPFTSPSLSAYTLIEGKLWYEVILPDGTKGYIMEDLVSASLDRELSVKKVDGQFSIISFYQRPRPGC